MRSALPAVRMLILSSPAVVAAIGDRVYLYHAQQEAAFPDVILRDITGQPEATLSGMGTPWRRRLSVTIRSPRYADAENVGEQILLVLNNFRGLQDGQFFQQIQVMSDYPMVDDTTNLFMRVLDFRLFHS